MPWKEQDTMDLRTKFALEAIQSDANISDLCRKYGISRPTGYKWRDRLLEQGLAGFHELSRAPQSSPTQLTEQQACALIRIKNAHPNWGPAKIRAIYLRGRPDLEPVSLSSVKRVLERAGLVRKRKRRTRTSAGRLFSERKASACNEVWTVDFKGHWRCRDLSRCEPLTIRDEYSCYLLVVDAMVSARTEDVQRCFECLFRKHGLPGAIRSDNGSPFANGSSVWGITRLSAWFLSLGIDLERSRPGKPQDNGAHERMHLDIAKEVERQPALSLKEQQTALDIWKEEFNEIRPHEALGMRTPSEVYTSRSEKWDGTTETLVYARKQSRKVNKLGEISWKSDRYRISTALQGQQVGLEPSATPGLVRVWYGELLLGELEPSTHRFIRADEGPDKARPLHVSA